MSSERAVEIALATTGGGRVTEVEREQEHGRPVWSVEFVHGGFEHDVDVDRETGAIVDDDRDDDRDDDTALALRSAWASRCDTSDSSTTGRTTDLASRSATTS
nr:PepSY domain-containing protein [Micromonospora sp. DSM 115978]